MSVSEFFGPYSARLATGSFLADLSTSYQEVLAQDGVTFPNAELLEAERLWNAHAARQRGSDELNVDGSVVDLSKFDRDTVGELLKSGRTALINAEKLQSVVELALVSKSGMVAAAELSNASADPENIAYVESLVRRYKHFVQIGVGIEEWPQPWQELIAYGFAGPTLTFPFDAKGVRYAAKTFNAPEFSDLNRRHFQRAFHIGFTVFQGLSNSAACNVASHEDRQLVGQLIGPFYRTSQAGCNDLLDQLVAGDILPAAVDWQAELQAAANNAADHFKED